MREYEAKGYEHLLGIKGFSDDLLKTHFKLYQGYVANTNKLAGMLGALCREGRTGTPEYAEMKRRFGWEFDGMRLHELYFDAMTKTAKPLASDSKLATMIRGEFGSQDAWERDFKSTGAMRGIGWVVLYQDPSGGRLFNAWINEHDAGHLASCTPLLIMDVFEHAFMRDYGTNRADYMEAFFGSIDWEVVSKRLR